MFIQGVIIGFISFPLVFIVSVLIYGSWMGWDKSEDSEESYKTEENGERDEKGNKK